MKNPNPLDDLTVVELEALEALLATLDPRDEGELDFRAVVREIRALDVRQLAAFNRRARSPLETERDEKVDARIYEVWCVLGLVDTYAEAVEMAKREALAERGNRPIESNR